VADQFACHLLWLGEQPLLPGRPYWLKLGTRTVVATVTEIKHRVDVNTQEHLAAKRLALNEVGVCNLSLDQPVAFESYARCRELGGCILIDRQSHATVGAGFLDFALRRAQNIHWQHLDVDRQARALIKGQTPRCLWFTGLSGSGKSTIANQVERRLLASGYHTYLLDGDNVRHGLNQELGFSPQDRKENIRRIAEVAKLFNDAGMMVITAFISPYQHDRAMARDIIGKDHFVEVHLATRLHVCEQRDPKGLYRKARQGEIAEFTGITAPYEAPENPALSLDTGSLSVEQSVAQILHKLAPRLYPAVVNPAPGG